MLLVSFTIKNTFVNISMQDLKKKQGFMFIVIGSMNTILDFLILFSLSTMGAPKTISNIASTGITFFISFTLNKKFTFKSKSNNKRELYNEMILFTVVTLFGLWIIQNIIISIIDPIFLSFLNDLKIDLIIPKKSLSLFISKCIATVFSLVWNFILYKKVVFKK